MIAASQDVGHARVRRRVVLIAALTVIAATLGLAVTPTMAASRTPYNTNLLKNPGFEAGPASPDGNTSVPIPSWQGDGNVTVVTYGTPGGFPTAAEGHRISGGHKFFTVGQPDAMGCGAIGQYIQAKGRDSAIDSGQVAVVFGGRVGTYVDQPDTALIKVYFIDGGGQGLDVFTSTQSGTNGNLLPLSATWIVPAQTRTVLLTLGAANTVGYCDAYFDKVSLKLVRL